MAWRISGTYVASCSCNLICPCPADGPPTSPDGVCRGLGVFHVAEGNLDDTDLSGVNLGLVNLFPSNLTAGNWKLGIVVDESASDEQANALEQIISGKEGGPFADFSGTMRPSDSCLPFGPSSLGSQRAYRRVPAMLSLPSRLAGGRRARALVDRLTR